MPIVFLSTSFINSFISFYMNTLNRMQAKGMSHAFIQPMLIFFFRLNVVQPISRAKLILRRNGIDIYVKIALFFFHLDNCQILVPTVSVRECKIVCVNRYCMNLLYAPYWGKQR